MDRARPQSNRKLIERTTWFVVLIFLIVGGSVTLANIDFSTRRVDRSKLSIETVQKGTMEVKVSANGQLEPKNIEYIAAQVTGRVAKAYVKAGDVVHGGELLVDLRNPDLIASEEQAYSAWQGAVMESRASEAELQTNILNQQIVLTQAQFNLEKAELQLEADTKLIADHIIAEIDFKRSQLNVSQLVKTRDIETSRLNKMRDNIKVQQGVKISRVTELARALDSAKNEAANLKIVAGISGIVQVVSVDVGQQLQPGSPIGRIAQLDQLYAELKVPAREATDVQVGQNVLIDTHAGTVNGTVTRVDPAVTDGTVIVDADVKVAWPVGARPQLPIEGIVYISQIPNALFVGKPAYVKSDSDVTVYKLDSAGRYATRVTVRAGKLSLNFMQVLQGLQASDRIVTSDIGDWRDKDRILIN